MSSYIKTTSCQKVTTKCCSGNLYAPQDEEEVLISKLTAKINQLEQKEKEFDLLNQDYKQLENDYTLLNEAKLRLEYEMKQRDETYTKRICDLKNDNKNLQDALNDKICVNKKLLEEKQCLESHLNAKNNAIDDINGKINNLNGKMSDTQNLKDELENDLNGLNDIKMNQRDKIAELVNDNKKLAKICQDQDHSLYLADQEKKNLQKKIRDGNADISNLNSKLRTHGNNLSNLQKQQDMCTEINIKLQNNLKDLENEFTNEKIDNDNLNNEMCQEMGARDEAEKKNEELRGILCDIENKYKYLNSDYDRIKIAHQKMTEERGIYQNENGKLKEHIMILTRQNQDLINEIDNVIKDDENMKGILNRKERMSFALTENDSILSQIPEDFLSTCDLDINSNNNNNQCAFIFHDNTSGLSQNNETGERSPSPRYTYSLEPK